MNIPEAVIIVISDLITAILVDSIEEGRKDILNSILLKLKARKRKKCLKMHQQHWIHHHCHHHHQQQIMNLDAWRELWRET